MTIIHGDCLWVLSGRLSNSVSCIVTDPPYGLSFMGKDWDHAIPGIKYWKEFLRVTKPGGYLIAMGGTRTYHRLACAIEGAGWEIRDCLMWIYGSGFPKSHNHFGIDGYGTALKPAYEPIIMAMKPCDGTFKNNAEKWGQAGINIHECRIGENPGYSYLNGKGVSDFFNGLNPEHCPASTKGRWPANVIFDEEAAAMLDEQSGYSNSKAAIRRNKSALGVNTKDNTTSLGIGDIFGGFNDSGGASRFFYCAKASSSERNKGLEDRRPEQTTDGCIRSNPESASKYQANSAPRKNPHPTVKPLKLMEYLIKLVMPPKDGILLDPFAGSGTTILAAKRLGFSAIGIEKEEEYVKIARARIS